MCALSLPRVAALACLLGASPALAVDTVFPVQAAVETDPVASVGDAADDPSIWIHPVDPALSTIIATDKLAALVVYDLSGQQLQAVPVGRPNNVDLRYHFRIGDGPRKALVAASERDADQIVLHTVDESTGLLETPAVGAIDVAYDPYGLCMYRSPVDGRLYVFVNAKTGLVEQWELADDGEGGVEGTLARSFSLATQPEGCVADDLLGYVFVGEEAEGIWRFGAEPGDGDARVQVDSATAPSGHLTPDVEGLTLYYGSQGDGYLIASSQGNSAFVLYDRAAPHAYVATVQIVAGTTIDGVTTTDGIDVTNAALGAAFPEGLFLAQDDSNPGGNQNFKLVDWGDLADAVAPHLLIDTGFDPRSIGAPPPGIFADDFEDGDGDAWSTSVGL